MGIEVYCTNAECASFEVRARGGFSKWTDDREVFCGACSERMTLIYDPSTPIVEADPNANE